MTAKGLEVSVDDEYTMIGNEGIGNFGPEHRLLNAELAKPIYVPIAQALEE